MTQTSESGAAADAVNIALKIDVHTHRGTCQCVPALMELLRQHGAGASFLFTLGPDTGGKQLRRLLGKRVVGRGRRASLITHYGWGRLMSGLIAPAPDIGRRCADLIRSVRAAGFEAGVRSFDEAAWQRMVDQGDAQWTRQQMERACARYRDIFGAFPHLHAAAGWRMNRHAFRLTQQLGFDYCSDTVGTHPFVPIYQAEVILCPQLPTTLPALDGLLDQGLSPDAAVDRILDESRTAPPSGHVYNAHAELEGGKLMRNFERLLQAWRGRGAKLLSLADYFDALPDKNLPRHELVRLRLPGTSREVAAQGNEFLT